MSKPITGYSGHSFNKSIFCCSEPHLLLSASQGVDTNHKARYEMHFGSIRNFLSLQHPRNHDLNQTGLLHWHAERKILSPRIYTFSQMDPISDNVLQTLQIKPAHSSCYLSLRIPFTLTF